MKILAKLLPLICLLGVASAKAEEKIVVMSFGGGVNPAMYPLRYALKNGYMDMSVELIATNNLQGMDAALLSGNIDFMISGGSYDHPDKMLVVGVLTTTMPMFIVGPPVSSMEGKIIGVMDCNEKDNSRIVSARLAEVWIQSLNPGLPMACGEKRKSDMAILMKVPNFAVLLSELKNNRADAGTFIVPAHLAPLHAGYTVLGDPRNIGSPPYMIYARKRYIDTATGLNKAQKFVQGIAKATAELQDNEKLGLQFTKEVAKSVASEDIPVLYNLGSSIWPRTVSVKENILREAVARFAGPDRAAAMDVRFILPPDMPR